MNDNSRYTRVMRERKFLLDDLPDFIVAKTPKKLIQDHHLINTNLLLRQVTSHSDVVYLLRKKYSPEIALPSKFHVTNLYLEEKEYHNFLSLPAYQFHKTRYILEIKKLTIYIDRMVLNLQEIIIAKAVFENEDAFKTFQLPFSYKKEVTKDSAYTGFEIARQHWTSMNY